jgi:abortive infection bacteriophage resistance protein
VVSVNEKLSRISVWMKKDKDKRQEIILISLDENSQLSIITVSGKIDFSTISKLSGTLKNEPDLTEDQPEDSGK